MTRVVTEFLVSEYESIVAELGKDPSDEAIIAALVRDAEWTEQGARTVLLLARQYGTSILRNALVLAAAMDVEDGEAGL